MQRESVLAPNFSIYFLSVKTRKVALDVTSESVLKMLGALRKEKYVDGKLETSNDVV